MHITGRCHCGFVSYEAEIEPDHVCICHCDDCQRLTGTAYRVSVSAHRENVRVLTGKPKNYVKFGDSGARRSQMFCPECGSPLFTTGDGRDAETIGIRLGSIDQRRDLKPSHQIWRRSALSWVDDIGELPARDEE